jgi:hypothetical protein
MTKMIDFVVEKINRLDEDLFDVDGDVGRIKIAASPVQPHEVKKMIAQGKGLRILVGAGKMRDMLIVWVGDSDSNVGAMHETIADQFGMSMMDRHVPLELTRAGKMRLTTTAIGIFDTPREVEDALDRNSEYKALFGSYKVDYQKLREAEEFQPEPIAVGDEILAGKFKNSKRVVKGFKTDKHGQPVLKTDRGDTQLFKPRIAKLDK